jgi:hypothetical protein
MTRWQRACAIALLISAAFGILFGFLPRNWIESVLGLDPDGGSGMLESLFIAVPAAIAVGSAVLAFRPHRSVSLDKYGDSASPLR